MVKFKFLSLVISSCWPVLGLCQNIQQIQHPLKQGIEIKNENQNFAETADASIQISKSNHLHYSIKNRFQLEQIQNEQKEIGIERSVNYKQVRGGDTGGGTFVLLPGGERVLLDLYIKDPNLGFMQSASVGQILPVTTAFLNLGIERIAVTHSLIQKARGLVHSWSDKSPVIMSALDEALSVTPFYYIKYDFGIHDLNFVMPENLKESFSEASIKTAAIYVRGFGALFSKSDFDHSSEIVQIATILHEGLRHVQLGYGYDLSNEDLQEITAMLVLRDPKNSGSLDALSQISLMGKSVKMQSAAESGCEVLTRYSIPDVSCEEIRRKTTATELASDLLKVAEALMMHIQSATTTIEADDVLRTHRKLVAVALTLNSFTTYQMTTEVPHGTNNQINDAIIDARNRSLNNALAYPFNTEYQREMKLIFDDLLSRAVLK